MWKKWKEWIRWKGEMRKTMKRLRDMQIRINRETMRMEQIQNEEESE